MFCVFWKGFARFGKVLRVLERFCAFWKLDFQAVIKSAASAASRETKIKETKIQGSARTTGLGGTTGTAGRRGTVGRRNGALPWILVSLILGFLEAALAADLITA